MKQKVGTLENILVWTKSQHRTFYSDARKVLLISNFGTGKTILLRAKAKHLAEKNPKSLGLKMFQKKIHELN